MKKAYILAATLLSGCSTMPQQKPTIPSETPDFNAHQIKSAAHNLALRAAKSGPLYDASMSADGKMIEYTPHFNEQAVFTTIRNQLDQAIPEPDMMIGDTKCVKKTVIDTTMKTVQLAMMDQLPRSHIFAETMNGISKSCNIDPASVQKYVHDSWETEIAILKGLNFNR